MKSVIKLRLIIKCVRKKCIKKKNLLIVIKIIIQMLSNRIREAFQGVIMITNLLIKQRIVLSGDKLQ